VPDQDLRSTSRRRDSASVGEVIDLVKDYARQETLGPLAGAGRWLSLGAAGSTFLGLGIVFTLIGVLRLLQTEVTAFDGAWSWLPYLIVLAVALVAAVVALSRVKKATLGKEPGRGSK
jgi:cytochrome c biogenesis protein CcdA